MSGFLFRNQGVYGRDLMLHLLYWQVIIIIIAHVQHAARTEWMPSSLTEYVQINISYAWKMTSLGEEMDKWCTELTIVVHVTICNSKLVTAIALVCTYMYIHLCDFSKKLTTLHYISLHLIPTFTSDILFISSTIVDNITPDCSCLCPRKLQCRPNRVAATHPHRGDPAGRE